MNWEENEVIGGRKRKSNPLKWKINERRIKRNKGESYVCVNRSVREAKWLKKVRKCCEKLDCVKYLTENEKMK